MAKPQLEDGFVRIANEIVEALSRIRISGEESQCLWVVLRKTYGWNKKEDRISLSQFALATGLKIPNVCRALRKLVSKKIVVIIKKDSSNITIYRFNKNFDTWIPLSKKIQGVSKLITDTIKNDNKPLSKKIHTIDNTKDTIQKTNTCARFEEFWKTYPKKRAKRAALKAWKSLNPSKDLTGKILNAVEAQKACPSWTKDNGQFVPAEELRRQRGE
ncbi:MAG: replication protein [Planctomycetota bacterium]|jgi:phage replication O-like protein O